jgi:hypothetical protein
MAKHWISGAIKHPGAEKKAAARAGESTQQYMEGHKNAPGTAGKRARLGLELSRMGRGRMKGGKMQAGSPYLTGERGPEIVVPHVPSTVVSNPQRRPGIGKSFEDLNPAPSLGGLGQAGDARLPSGGRIGRGLNPNAALRAGMPHLGAGPARTPVPAPLGRSAAGPGMRVPGVPKPQGIRGTADFKALMSNLNRRSGRR